MGKPRSTAVLCASVVFAGALAFNTGAAQAQAEQHSFGTVDDPYFGEALFHYYQHDYFSALSQALVTEQAQRLRGNRPQHNQLLSELYLSYGLHQEAEEVLGQLDRRNATLAVQDHAWLDVAKAAYRRGEYRKASDAVRRIGDELDRDSEEEREALKGLLRMADGDYKGAAEILEDLSGRSEWGSYGGYNLGIALLKMGRVEDGVEELNRVGQRNYATEELRALKDQANVALGFLFLRTGDAARARVYLERVRLNGAHANRALLGIGWAYLMLGQARNALVPFTELQQRPAIDSAVLEAQLAVPFALSQLQAYEPALEQYVSAESRYEGEIKRIEGAIQSIDIDRFLVDITGEGSENEMDWLKHVEGWPTSPESRVFFRLMSEHWFREALRNYRGLRVLQGNLEEWITTIDIYDSLLAARRDAVVAAPDESSRSDPDPSENLVTLGARDNSVLQRLTSNSRQALQDHLVQLQSLRKRAVALQPQLQKAVLEHSRFLENLVVYELEQEKNSLTQYLEQTRLAMAQIYDRLLNLGGARP